MKEDIEEFINYLAVERGLADNTLLAYRRDLNKYSAYLKKKNIKENNCEYNKNMCDEVIKFHIIQAY